MSHEERIELAHRQHVKYFMRFLNILPSSLSSHDTTRYEWFTEFPFITLIYIMNISELVINTIWYTRIYKVLCYCIKHKFSLICSLTKDFPFFRFEPIKNTKFYFNIYVFNKFVFLSCSEWPLLTSLYVAWMCSALYLL